MAGNISRCTRCSFFCKDKVDSVKHQFEAHCHESTFTYICEIPFCLHLFKRGSTYSSCLTHCNRKHPNWRNQLALQHLQSSTSCHAEVNHSNDESEIELDHGIHHLDPQHHEPDHDIDNSLLFSNTSATIKEDIILAAAKFLISLKENYRLTQVALDYTIDSVMGIVKLTSQEIEQSVKSKLQENNNSKLYQIYLIVLTRLTVLKQNTNKLFFIKNI